MANLFVRWLTESQVGDVSAFRDSSEEEGGGVQGGKGGETVARRHGGRAGKCVRFVRQAPPMTYSLPPSTAADA